MFSAFWVEVKNEYPEVAEIAEIALESLLFLSAYICQHTETSFSVMSAI